MFGPIYIVSRAGSAKSLNNISEYGGHPVRLVLDGETHLSFRRFGTETEQRSSSRYQGRLCVKQGEGKASDSDPLIYLV